MSRSRSLLIVMVSIVLSVQLRTSLLKQIAATHISHSAVLGCALQYGAVVIAVVASCACSLMYVAQTLILRSRKVFMVDFSCLQPNEDQKLYIEKAEYLLGLSGKFTISSVEFQRKVLLRSGIGEETYMPYHMFIDDDEVRSRELRARMEAQQALYGATDKLLRKTRTDPRSIDILITNCSMFSPAPSMAAMIMNRFKMREDVKAYHLAGMGCSASVIACNLARDLLRVHPNKCALVVSTENGCCSRYDGNNKSQLVSNCLFRLGCAAMLFTNKRQHRASCKYELLECLRTNKAADDRAFRCVQRMEDDKGEVGVCISKDLMGVAADALRLNIVSLGPRVLPLSEQVLFVYSYICRKLLDSNLKQYQPDFTKAFDHFCLHAGGRAVIDEIQKSLNLTHLHVEASRATLHRFGNISSSCPWYVLAYMEAKQHVRKGDKVWMLGLGSGFKCNSVVWQALSDVPIPSDSPWLDSMHRYPAAL